MSKSKQKKCCHSCIVDCTIKDDLPRKHNITCAPCHLYKEQSTMPDGRKSYRGRLTTLDVVYDILSDVLPCQRVDKCDEKCPFIGYQFDGCNCSDSHMRSQVRLAKWMKESKETKCG